ncbi:hypothetical protein [uncultured Roseivirga sp.]|uniref:hypothetical protein n=1 Tax=uncultured Roseivirga sp. TaxID=543088 RepID=UPI0030D7B35D
MNKNIGLICAQLHAIEDDLMQINGLMAALQKIQPDDGASTCVVNAIEDRLEHFQTKFYDHWKHLTNE